MFDNLGTVRVDQGPSRIEMLANGGGIPISQGRDDFGYRFGGPALNEKSISIRWEGQDLLAMKAPSLVASEMAKDAGPGAGFSVGDGGFIVFKASGAHADKAIRRAAALIRACPISPLATYREKLGQCPRAPRSSASPNRGSARTSSAPPSKTTGQMLPDHRHLGARAPAREPHEALGRLRDRRGTAGRLQRLPPRGAFGCCVLTPP